MKLITFSLMMLVASTAHSNEFTYQAIAERHAEGALSKQQVAEAKMQGECLVGIKALNFKKQNEFDPVAEWSSFRSSSLLEQFPPCQVLVMLEVAQKELRKEN